MATKKKKEVKEKDKIECKICHRNLVPNANTFFLARDGSQYDCEPYNRYMPICKRCSKEYILDANGNVDEDKFKYILSELDKVFVPTEFFNVKSKHTVDKVLGEYLNVVNGSGGKYKGYGYQDSIKFAFQQENIKKDNMKITQEVEDFWNIDGEVTYTPKELKRLQNRYDELLACDDNTIAIPSKYIMLKSIPKMELEYEKLITKDPRLAKTTLDSLNLLFKELGIDPNKMKESKAAKSTVDLFNKRIEQTRPIFDFERDLGNKDEVREFMELYLYAYLRKANDERSAFDDRLQAELDKYTPDLEIVIEDDEEEDGDE